MSSGDGIHTTSRPGWPSLGLYGSGALCAAAEPAAEPPVLSLRRVLMPLDFSGPSRDALAYARRLAAHFRAELLVVHVSESPLVDPHLAEFDTQTFEENARQSARTELEKVVAELRAAGHGASARVLSGVPWHEITEFARWEPVDLIVAGTRGYTGLKHILLGSTAERIIRHASCPVLVVRGGPG